MTKFMRQSEYTHALNLARKARRRGDVVSANRWLKFAERNIAANERRAAYDHAATLREIELATAQARLRPVQAPAQAPAQETLTERIDRLIEQFEREDEEEELRLELERQKAAVSPP